MRKFQTILLSCFFLLAFISSQAQMDNPDMEQQVLQKGFVDSMFVFGKWTESGGSETHLKYLGQVKTKSGETYRIMNSIWLWGEAHKATTRILIFTENNRYIGCYTLGIVYDLPDKLENGKLIFSNHGDKDCNPVLKTVVDFSKGLPKQFFVKCQGDYGTTFSLSTD